MTHKEENREREESLLQLWWTGRCLKSFIETSLSWWHVVCVLSLSLRLSVICNTLSFGLAGFNLLEPPQTSFPLRPSNLLLSHHWRILQILSLSHTHSMQSHLGNTRITKHREKPRVASLLREGCIHCVSRIIAWGSVWCCTAGRKPALSNSPCSHSTGSSACAPSVLWYRSRGNRGEKVEKKTKKESTTQISSSTLAPSLHS